MRRIAHISFPVLLAALFLSFFSMTSPAYADIYKFVDGDGVIHFSNVPQDKDSQRIIKETPGCRPIRTVKAIRPSSVPHDDCTPYAGIIDSKCEKYGVDPTLVRAIIKAESDYDPNAVSGKGAKGLMQLMPGTASDMGVSDIFDPEQNIEGGVRYFKGLLDNFSGDVELSVAAYNCGQGKVIRSGNAVPEISETKNYVRKVMKLSNNPVTGMSFSRPIYKVELKDGSILFTDNPAPAASPL